MNKYSEISLETLKLYQRYLVFHFLNVAEWNEFCFNINPNSIAFQQSKTLYQLELKNFLEKLNLDEFEDSNNALRFIIEFYDHYLKIIELNNEVIKNISINTQYYNNYNIFCLSLYLIIFVSIIIKCSSDIFHIVKK